VLVFDDCSEDGTWDYLCSVHDPKLRIMRNPRRMAMGPAWNSAVRASSGEYVFILQDDDLALPGLVSRIRRAVSDYPAVGLICFATWLIRDDAAEPLLFWQPDEEEYVPGPQALLRFARRWTISSTQVVFSRSAFDEHGGFDETSPVMSDAEAILRWMIHYDTLLLRDRLSLRRVWSGSVSAATEGTEEMADTMTFLVKSVLYHAASSGRFGPRQIAQLRKWLPRTFLKPLRPGRPTRSTRARLGRAGWGLLNWLRALVRPRRRGRA
jgi:glycosyltransferase involved in cell wall biosynthesis